MTDGRMGCDQAAIATAFRPWIKNNKQKAWPDKKHKHAMHQSIDTFILGQPRVLAKANAWVFHTIHGLKAVAIAATLIFQG